MKILFLLDYIYSGETTNIALAKQLANQLAVQNEIWYLCNALPTSTGLPVQNTTVFTTYADRCTYQIINEVRKAKKGAVAQVLTLCKSPKALLNLCSTAIFNKSMAEKVFQQQIETICKTQNFDVVVSVSCPHYTMFALAGSQITAKKVCYMLDPYTGNQALPMGVSIRREIQLYKKIHLAFVTDLMLQENKQNALQAYLQKMVVLPFPGVEEKHSTGIQPKIFPENKIISAFVGNFYPKVRSPKYLFTLFSKLKNENCLVCVGGGKEGFAPNFFEEYKTLLQQKLVLHDTVTKEQATEIMLNANVLVNIGNTITNQLPSKLYEYISTGKPILNLIKTAKCPSVAVLQNYPLALTVQEGDFTPATLAKVASFLQNATQNNLPFAQVAQLYANNTPQHVGAIALNALQALFNTGENA